MTGVRTGTVGGDMARRCLNTPSANNSRESLPHFNDFGKDLSGDLAGDNKGGIADSKVRGCDLSRLECSYGRLRSAMLVCIVFVIHSFVARRDVLFNWLS